MGFTSTKFGNRSFINCIPMQKKINLFNKKTTGFSRWFFILQIYIR